MVPKLKSAGSGKSNAGNAFDRRERIIESSAELFRKKGYHDVSITDIVNHSGVGCATFYNHFKNKEELFFECADRVFYDLDDETAGIGSLGFKEKMRAWLRFFISNPQLRNILKIVRVSAITNPAFEKKLHQIKDNLCRAIMMDIDTEMQKGNIIQFDASLLAAHLLLLRKTFPNTR